MRNAKIVLLYVLSLKKTNFDPNSNKKQFECQVLTNKVMINVEVDIHRVDRKTRDPC